MTFNVFEADVNEKKEKNVLFLLDFLLEFDNLGVA